MDAQGISRKQAYLRCPPTPAMRLRCDTRFAISLAPYVRSHSGPSGPKSPKKSKKGSRRLSTAGSKRLKKSRKRSKTIEKQPFLNIFKLFFDFFVNLFRPRGRKAPGTFFRLFWDFGPKGPNDSCKGPRRLQYEICTEVVNMFSAHDRRDLAVRHCMMAMPTACASVAV